MTDIEEELGEGDIHLRDKFQFEVKSEYSPIPGRANNTYELEFYFFIPTSLHINKQTYVKKHFYYDQTSLIRLKTPHVALKKLANLDSSHSPLFKIRQMYLEEPSPPAKDVLTELKLYANMARSAIRDSSNHLLEKLKHPATQNVEISYQALDTLCQEIATLRTSFRMFLNELAPKWRGTPLDDQSQYIEEFLCLTVQYHLTPVLHELQQHHPQATDVAAIIADRILWETNHKFQTKDQLPVSDDPEKNREYAVYRSGLLKKFVWEALFLNIIRKEPAKPFMEFAAILAAGLAMLVYIVVLTLPRGGGILPNSLTFLNSSTFIVLSVLLYVVKDRLKDAVKNLSATFASRWFPDYQTDIVTPDGQNKLGFLKEYFSFVNLADIPKKIQEVRSTGFHTELERAERQETTFYYKKQVTLFNDPEEHHPQGQTLNDIFRFNIVRFLLKASDAHLKHLEVDPETGRLITLLVPKVYHINIIMRRTFIDSSGQTRSDIRKFRIVIDKEGIKRVEKVV